MNSDNFALITLCDPYEKLCALSGYTNSVY